MATCNPHDLHAICLCKENQMNRLLAENKRMREALIDISMLHEDGFSIEDLEKKYGFLGWLCCSQLKSIAKSALGEGGE